MTKAGLHDHLSERDHLREVVEHLGHLVPSQGPMTTFVHHNTLHGLQHLPFDEAIEKGEAFYGARGYWPVEAMRSQYRAGRISDADLDAVMADREEFAGAEVIGTIGDGTVTNADIRQLHLTHGVNAVDPERLRFLIHERDATRRLMDDVSPEIRGHTLTKAGIELTEGVERVGRDLTVGGWLGGMLGLDIASAVTSAALRDLSAARIPRKDVTALLERLGVPRTRHAGYLELVDGAMRDAPAGVDPDRARAVWLAAEARLVDAVARRHFDLPGDRKSVV